MTEQYEQIRPVGPYSQTVMLPLLLRTTSADSNAGVNSLILAAAAAATNRRRRRR
jgi:hypothetical protein